MITTVTLDVTKIEPRLKHPTIFRQFDDLAEGEEFVIHNDHDPKPLYYQLLGERGNIFGWEYLQQGPEHWKVKITKNKTGVVPGPTVGAIAAKDYRKAEVFKKLGIDFCCGGGKTLKEAANEVGVTEEQLNAELLQAENIPASGSQDYNKWNLDFLADFITNTHHRYVKENAVVIDGLAEKVRAHHADAHPELNELAFNTHAFLTDLQEHMVKEEQILFPQIKKLFGSQKDNQPGSSPATGSIAHAVQMMEQEHEASGEDLRFFRTLTNNYTLPADACNSYSYLFAKMQEFENDLFQHIHLENNILFPKAVDLEKKLAA